MAKKTRKAGDNTKARETAQETGFDVATGMLRAARRERSRGVYLGTALVVGLIAWNAFVAPRAETIRGAVGVVQGDFIAGVQALIEVPACKLVKLPEAQAAFCMSRCGIKARTK